MKWAMKGLHIRCRKPPKSLVAYLSVLFRDLLHVVHFQPLRFFVVCSFQLKHCMHLWRPILVCRIISGARSR